jgi:hypothetical protein
MLGRMHSTNEKVTHVPLNPLVPHTTSSPFVPLNPAPVPVVLLAAVVVACLHGSVPEVNCVAVDVAV